MVSFCFYFQVHQPFRLRKYPVFDIGNNHDYFDNDKNQEIMKKVAEKCYLPTNKLMLDLLKHEPRFKISYSLSGTFLDQIEKMPELLESFKKLVDTGRVELLDETYYHSLSFLYSKAEFVEQVNLHKQKIKQLFNYTPKVFRNTELVYNNELARFIEDLGYIGILAEGADRVLGWRSPDFLYQPATTSKISLLLRNYKLSDDISFRFSNKGWNEYPLTTEKFARWANKVNGNGNVINLFMDYETFGEHQWEDTGIFEFLRNLPKELLKHPDNDFKTPSEIVKIYKPIGQLDIHSPISWADMERDLSAWLGNKMQETALRDIYGVEHSVKQSDDPALLADWRKLQTSDHFYYMCTKWFSDGDVHKYFNPYDSPYDAFISFMNILNDIKSRLKQEVMINGG
ncbi:MAG: glycoside hydrolase family 57 protein [Nanoarchaeota archaeon]|nr:glycoside hydrolase family 57 protein [Nanoarchaeota archaeon]